MIDFTLNEQQHILHIKPKEKLQAEDFMQLSNTLDPYLKLQGKLKGLIIETKQFPGWKNFAALKAHLQFIRKHYDKVEKIALVTDTKLANVATLIIPHLLHIQVKHFSYGQIDLAKQWIE